MSIEAELASLEAEIASLEAELPPLQQEHDHIFRQVTSFESENKYKNLSKPNLPKIQPPRPADALDDAPALIHYSYFDDSLKKYFKESTASVDSPAPNTDEILLSIQLKTAAGNLALNESIFRFGGITAFSINDHLYDADDDALLGLRFDVMSHTTNQFLKPHYIILRRKRSQLKDSSSTLNPWHIFRYTTPAYVPLDQFSQLLLVSDENYGLQSFVESVRSRLVGVQYKHDKFHQISRMTYESVFKFGSSDPIISNIDTDLACHRVVLSISTPHSNVNGAHSIELYCGPLHVESSVCKTGASAHDTFVTTILQHAQFSSLVETFSKVFSYLKENDLL